MTDAAYSIDGGSLVDIGAIASSGLYIAQAYTGTGFGGYGDEYQFGVTSSSGIQLEEYISLNGPTPLGVITSVAAGTLPNMSLVGTATGGGGTNLEFVNTNTSPTPTVIVSSFTSDVQVPSPVPLPATAWLLLSALGGLGIAGHRRLSA